MATWIEWVGYVSLSIFISVTAATTHYFLKTIFEDHKQIGINEKLNTQRYNEINEKLEKIQEKLKELDTINKRLSAIGNKLEKMEKTLTELSNTVSEHEAYLVPLKLQRETTPEDLHKFKTIVDALIEQKLKERGENK